MPLDVANPNTLANRDRKSCLKETTRSGEDSVSPWSRRSGMNTVRHKIKRVRYDASTNFDTKPSPVCKSDLLLQQAENVAVDSSELDQMQRDIMARSPFYPNTPSPSAPSSSDVFERSSYHPLASLNPQRRVPPGSRLARRSTYTNELETRIAELEQDRNTLLQAHSFTSAQLYHAENKAQSLALRLRLAKAKQQSSDTQMQLIASQFNNQFSLNTPPKLEVKNPDYIHVPELDSDYTFDSISS